MIIQLKIIKLQTKIAYMAEQKATKQFKAKKEVVEEKLEKIYIYTLSWLDSTWKKHLSTIEKGNKK
jgi:preprotein translocase subunit SecA